MGLIILGKNKNLILSKIQNAGIKLDNFRLKPWFWCVFYISYTD